MNAIFYEIFVIQTSCFRSYERLMGASVSSSFVSVCFATSVGVVGFGCDLFCVRPVKQEESKTCRPTKNQFLYSSWDLGRQIDPAFAIVAAAVGALPNKLFVMGVSIAIL
jgi:hypothetical protein